MWWKKDGFIWRDWDAIVAISLFTSVNTRLQLLSKNVWAMIHRTSTHVNGLLLPVRWSPQTFYLIFFKKVAEYGQFTLSIIFKKESFYKYKEVLNFIHSLKWKESNKVCSVPYKWKESNKVCSVPYKTNIYRL